MNKHGKAGTPHRFNTGTFFEDSEFEVRVPMGLSEKHLITLVQHEVDQWLRGVLPEPEEDELDPECEIDPFRFNQLYDTLALVDIIPHKHQWVFKYAMSLEWMMDGEKADAKMGKERKRSKTYEDNKKKWAEGRA